MNAHHMRRHKLTDSIFMTTGNKKYVYLQEEYAKQLKHRQ